MFRWIIAVAMVVPFFAQGAESFHSLEAIRQAAESAAAAGPDTDVEAALDPGLRLPVCRAPLESAMRGSATAEVACPDPGWRLYVPLRVQRFETVWVLRRPVGAGEAIAPDAVAMERRDVARLPAGVLPASRSVAGRVARRALPAGSVLLQQDAQSPPLVRRGDPVVLLARRGGIEVRASGRALGSAGVDELVSVENQGSRRVVQGRLLPSGEVLVQ